MDPGHRQAFGLHQARIRIGWLRMQVEVLHVRVGRRAVEVKAVILDVLAVIPFAVAQAEEAILENGVLADPGGQGRAEPLLVIGNTGQAIFAPAAGARSGPVAADGGSRSGRAFPNPSPLRQQRHLNPEPGFSASVSRFSRPPLRDLGWTRERPVPGGARDRHWLRCGGESLERAAWRPECRCEFWSSGVPAPRHPRCAHGSTWNDFRLWREDP